MIAIVNFDCDLTSLRLSDWFVFEFGRAYFDPAGCYSAIEISTKRFIIIARLVFTFPCCLLTVLLSAELDDLDTAMALARIHYVELLENTFMADTALKIIIQNLSNVAQVGVMI